MLAYLLVISIAFTVVAASLLQLVGEYLYTQKEREESRIAGTIADEMTSLLRQRDAEGMYARAVALSEQYGGRVLVLDTYGVVQVDAQSSMNGVRFATSEVKRVMEGAVSASAFYQANQGASGFAATGFLSLMQPTAMTGIYAHAVETEQGRIGAIVFITSAQAISESLAQITRQVLLWMVIVALFVILMSNFIMRRFMRPINELNDSIAKMAKGDLTSRVKVHGHNEFSELARAFNLMCERLESLDKSRNQFVSNASHELKTPLSTMKILLETLLYQETYDPAMQKEFLSDINKEIDRLSSIISDLLTLVNIDSGEMRLKVGPVALKELLLDTMRLLAPLARERGIEMEYTAKEPIATMGDKMKLTQVIYNLIDNAIKYTPRGGKVRVELTRQGKTAVLKVIDNGIGIPREDQIHVFDRFYRVDKARSRETGGTGLGLSIVKQIVLLHEGDISVASEEDVGSTFTVELPIID